MNKNIQILKTAKMNEIHQPMPLTPHQQHLVRVTPFDKLPQVLFESGLRDFVIIRDDSAVLSKVSG